MYEQIEHASDVYDADQIAHFKQEGLWLDRLLWDYLAEHASQRPDHTAVVDERRTITWRELQDRVERLATGLIELGLQPGDFFAIQLPNIIEFIEAYLAAERAGLRLLTIMTIYRDKDVRYMLEKCGVRGLVVSDVHRGFDHEALAHRLHDTLPTLDHVIVVGESSDDSIGFESLAISEPADPSVLDARRPDPDAMKRVSFTSGTTGRPKGVVHTYNTSLVTPLLTAEAVGLDATTPIWMPSPIAHATGLMFGVYDSLMMGAKLALQDRWDPRTGLEIVSRERAAFTVSATPFIDAMLQEPDLQSFDLSEFRWFLSGGAPIPPRLVNDAKERMDTLLLRVFGQSEAPLHTLNFPGDPWEKITSRDGRPLRGVKIKIVDPSDRSLELERGEVGEYATWGPHVFLGYYDEPELTAEAKSEDGWYFSGDLCLQDDDDYVLYVDRIKDIINRGGVKISALEVEDMLTEHPDIRAAAVVAEPDERLGERACAFVILEQGASLTLDDVRAHLDGLGATKQKWPERLEVVDEFPTTPTGKIQKTLLRDELEAV